MAEFTDQFVAPPKPATRPPRISKTTLDAYRAEEPELIASWQTKGCEKSLETLIKRYQPLILSHMQKILGGRSVGPSHRADLQQEATLAFIDAVNRFNPEFGWQLSAYASQKIRKTLLRYALDFRHGYRIGTSSAERKAFYAALSLRAERIHQGESDVLSDADIDKICEQTGAPRQTAEQAVQSIYANSSTLDDAPEIEDKNLGEHEGDMSIQTAMAALKPFVDGLEERQKAIFDAFMKDDGIDAFALAKQFDISPERIGQIRRDMLADMQIFLKKNGIRSDDLF